MIAREEQRDVHRHAREGRLLDGGRSFPGAGNFDEQIAPAGPFVKCFGLGHRGLGVVGKERRDFQRYPAIHGGRAFVDRREQIGSARQVLHRQLEKQCFAGKAHTHEPANFGIIRFAMGDSVIEDRWIRCESRD